MFNKAITQSKGGHIFRSQGICCQNTTLGSSGYIYGVVTNTVADNQLQVRAGMIKKRAINNAAANDCRFCARQIVQRTVGYDLRFGLKPRERFWM
jgi:hypothetical protein